MLPVWSAVDEGPGNSSYLAEVGEGVALVVDPGRDPRPCLNLAARHGLRAGFAAETHLHADFVSGDVSVLCGGPDDWAKATGESLEHG